MFHLFGSQALFSGDRTSNPQSRCIALDDTWAQCQCAFNARVLPRCLCPASPAFITKCKFKTLVPICTMKWQYGKSNTKYIHAFMKKKKGFLWHQSSNFMLIRCTRLDTDWRYYPHCSLKTRLISALSERGIQELGFLWASPLCFSSSGRQKDFFGKGVRNPVTTCLLADSPPMLTVRAGCVRAPCAAYCEGVKKRKKVFVKYLYF